MKTYLLGCVLLLASAPVAAAGSVGGFAYGGVNVSNLVVEDDAGNELDTDGGGINLTAGVRFKPGIMVRAQYAGSTHDDGTVCATGFGCAEFNEDVDVAEFRLGVFYAPEQRGVVGVRAGAGYQDLSYEVPSLSVEAGADGLFVEAAVLLRVKTIVDFEIGGALLALTTDEGEDAGGAELRAGAMFHAGPVDIGVLLRNVYVDADLPGGGSETYDYSALQLMVGGAWGYP